MAALFFFDSKQLTEGQRKLSHTRFVIQSLPRSGAGLVMSALARHPECKTSGLMFNGELLDSAVAMRAAGSWKSLFDACTQRSELHGTSVAGSAAGFIAYRVPSTLQSGRGIKWEWSQTLWQYLYDKGHDAAKIIRVWRDDPIARAISAAVALNTGVMAAGKLTTTLRMYQATLRSITIQPWLFRYFLEEWEAAENLPQGKVQTRCVSYESLVSDWGGGIKQVQEFLGLEPVELTSPLAKLGRTPPHTLVSNWELLVESFRSTRWEQHFDRYFRDFLPVYVKQAAEDV